MQPHAPAPIRPEPVQAPGPRWGFNRRGILGLGTLLVLGLVVGCVTPVIPLPPPDPKKMLLKDVDPKTETVTIEGLAGATFAGAYVFLLNRDTGLGVIHQAETDGSFLVTGFKAKDGSVLDIWTKQAPNEETSDVISVIVDYTNGLIPRR